MKNIFKDLLITKPKRNVFNLSHERKLSCDFGKLIPIFCADLVPGDTFRNTSEIFMRFAPLIAPVMHRIDVFTHFFFVPNRLVMPKWPDFITGNDPEVTIPTYNLSAFSNAERPELLPLCTDGSLADYFGLPTLPRVSPFSAYQLRVQILPFLMYQLIFNEYYRDQNLQDEVNLKYEEFDSVDLWKEIFTLRTRNWEKDYFTSALPWAQKGDEVTIPVGLEGRYAPVVYMPNEDTWGPYGDGHTILRSRAGGQTIDPGTTVDSGQSVSSPESYVNTRINVRSTLPSAEPGLVDVDPNGNLWADLSNASNDRSTNPNADPNNSWRNVGSSAVGSGTINDLRTAFQIQRWLEKNARAGTRYIEQILSHFGVRTPDSRLQRPEFIGGGRNPVVISEVLQTSETSETPQANMAGHGVSAGTNNRFKYKALEHGYIIGLMSVMPRTAYQQGVPRHFLRNDKFDFFWPTFAHLGEQPVLNQEIYHQFNDFSEEGGTSPIPPGKRNKDTFGYQSRYSDYKYIPNTVHGDFRNSLLFWHLGRVFNGLPPLNENFIKVNTEENTDLHRIFAVEDYKTPLWCQIYNKCSAVRPMPRFAVPGYADHF